MDQEILQGGFYTVTPQEMTMGKYETLRPCINIYNEVIINVACCEGGGTQKAVCDLGGCGKASYTC